MDNSKEHNNNKSFEEVFGTFSNELRENLRELSKKIHEKNLLDIDKPISYEKACEYLGVSRATLSKLVNSNKINFTSLNKSNPNAKKKFYISDLDKFLRDSRSKTIDEIRNS